METKDQNQTESPQPSEPQITIGNFLRQEREKKKISLKAVAHATKINPTMLEYLEKDDINNLPDKAYVIGYVKSYARFLHINLENCLDLVNKTYVAFTPSRTAIKLPTRNAHPRGKIAAFMAIGFMATLGLAGGITYFYFEQRDTLVSEENEADHNKVEPEILTENTPLFKEHGLQNPTPTPTEVEKGKQVPAAAEQKPAPTQVEPKKANNAAPIPTPAAQAPIPAPVENKPAVVETEKPVDDNKKIELLDGNVTFSTIATPLYTTNKNASAEEVSTLFPPQFQYSMVKGKQNVFINATDGDTWLTYKADDRPIKKFILKKGQNLLIRGDDIRLFLGNVNVTKIFYNGDMIDVTTPSGIKSLVFPDTKAKDLKLPLFVYKKDGTVITSEEYLKTE